MVNKAKRMVVSLLIASFLVSLFLPVSMATSRSEVIRLYGDDRYETSIKISEYSFKSAKHVVIASGDTFADALAGGVFAIDKDAPILLTGKTLTKGLKNEINRLKPNIIYILGGESSVSKSIENELSNLAEVTRLAGKNRYETSNVIRQEFEKGKAAPNMYGGVSGENFADALVAAPYFTSGDNLFINLIPKGQGPMDKSIVVGGKNWIGQNENVLARIAGSDRFDTSAKIYDSYGKDVAGYKGYKSKTLILASGHKFADALAAAPMVHREKGILSLIKDEDFGDFYDVLNRDKPEKIIIVGGYGTLSELAEKISDTVLRHGFVRDFSIYKHPNLDFTLRYPSKWNDHIKYNKDGHMIFEWEKAKAEIKVDDLGKAKNLDEYAKLKKFGGIVEMPHKSQKMAGICDKETQNGNGSTTVEVYMMYVKDKKVYSAYINYNTEADDGFVYDMYGLYFEMGFESVQN